MKKKYWLLAFILVTIVLMPAFVLAQSTGAGLPNPIGVNDPRIIIGYVIRAILGIVGSLALLMFIYGGFLWIMSAGNEERVTQGKKIIIYSTVGLAVIFFSYILVTFVIGALTGGGQDDGDNFNNPDSFFQN
jgi:hypothetical protein